MCFWTGRAPSIGAATVTFADTDGFAIGTVTAAGCLAADIVGVSRQVAVLAYQMGDGFMNMIVLTNAVLMGILGICGIPYGRWFRFIWPLMLQLVAAGAVTLVIAVAIDYR